MRYQETVFPADSSKGVRVEPEDGECMQNIRTGQHPGEPVHHIPVRPLGRGRRVPGKPRVESHPEQGSDAISITSIDLRHHRIHGRKVEGHRSSSFFPF